MSTPSDETPTAQQDPLNASTLHRPETASNSMRPAGGSADKRPSMPPLDERFNVHRTGLIERSYHFRDQAGRVAFTDHWLSLSTAGESLAAIKAMVDRAAERGWKTVGLKGSPEFVRLSWIAANVQGLKAVGHTPTAADRETVLKERARLEAIQSAEAPQNQVDAISRVQTTQIQRTVTERGGQEFNAQRHLAAAIEKALTDGKVPSEIRGQVRALMAAEGSRRLLSGGTNQGTRLRRTSPASTRPNDSAGFAPSQ